MPPTPDALVVLVDDSPSILRMFARQLGGEYAVRTFESGTALLEALETLRPSLFVLDWLIPDVDGVELCRRIRSELTFDPVPIAFFTGMDPSPENVRTALAAGADVFLHKGGEPAIVLSQMRALIESYRRLTRYLRIQAAVLSALKHDIANWLTGISTSVDFLPPGASLGGEVGEDIETIRASAKQLAPAIGDLGEILGLEWGLGIDRHAAFSVPALLREAQGFLKWSRREVAVAEGPDLEATGLRRPLARVLYYVARLVETRVVSPGPLRIAAAPEGSGVRIGLAAPGDLAGPIREAFEGPVRIGDPVARRDLLATEYVRRILRLHETHLEFDAREGETSFSFLLPAVTRT